MQRSKGGVLPFTSLKQNPYPLHMLLDAAFLFENILFRYPRIAEGILPTAHLFVTVSSFTSIAARPKSLKMCVLFNSPSSWNYYQAEL